MTEDANMLNECWNDKNEMMKDFGTGVDDRSDNLICFFSIFDICFAFCCNCILEGVVKLMNVNLLQN